jgi:hypothetical protein
VIVHLVVVGLGIAMLGAGTGTTLATAGGLIAFALLGLGAALLLGRRRPDAEHAPSLNL